MSQWVGEVSNRSRPSELHKLGNYANELRKERREEKMKMDEAKSMVALESVKQENKTREYLMKAYQNYWNKSPQDRALFDSSDAGKEFKKVMKKYLPQLVGDRGDLVPLPAQSQTGGYKPQSQQEALEYQKLLAQVKQTVAQGKQLSAVDAARLMQTVGILGDGGYMDPNTVKQVVSYAKQFIPGVSSTSEPVNVNQGGSQATGMGGIMGRASNAVTGALSKFGRGGQQQVGSDDVSSFISKYK